MTEQEAIDMLEIAAKSGDTEAAHSTADAILCTFLRELGYENLVAAWDEVDKWYA